jgi:hypothetical protein
VIFLSLALALLAQNGGSVGFEARVVVEEAGHQTTSLVRFGPGKIQVQPSDADVYFVLDTSDASVTLVDPEQKRYYRLDPPEYQRLIASGIIDPSWFFWVNPISPDLIEGATLAKPGKTTLPDGRPGLLYTVQSSTYHREVARYEVDPHAPADLFFQWRDVYPKLWGEGTPAQTAAQDERFELYAELAGVPVVSEERFVFLSRVRTVRLEKRQSLEEDAFQIPEEYQEGDAAKLYWESIGERLLRQLGFDRKESTFGVRQTH